ncbi:MAG: late competence development ComFB family protein [Candidatus Omnitrophica bacterium]|nr:late competence development ComFB family protein [Candidatus Omnitrophota bacterium]
MTEVHNYMEDIVSDVLDEVLVDMEDSCKCEKCKHDVLALALNKLPPKYVVTEKGRLYTKLSELEVQFKADVIKEIIVAFGAVKARPQH